MENVNNSFRIDKNVAHNILDLDVFKDDLLVAKSLIYYFCYSYQNDLFGFGTIDPYDFSKAFGFTANYLRSKHPDPLQLRGLSQNRIEELHREEEENPENKIWDSILENALWHLYTTKVVFTRGAKITTSDGKKKYTNELDSIQFLRNLKAVFTKSKAGQIKIMYHYELDPAFLNNLTEYYLKGDRDVIQALRKPGLDDIYIYLKNLRDSLYHGKNQQTEALPNFDMLCKLAHINDERPRQRKYKLNKALDKLKDTPDMEFTYDWDKQAGQKYKYKLVMHFKPKFSSLEELEKYRQSERIHIFRQNLIHELIKIFKKKYPSYFEDNREENVLKWLKSGMEKDQSEKALAFQNAYFTTWGKTVESFDKQTINWLKALPKVKNLNDIISYEETKA